MALIRERQSNYKVRYAELFHHANCFSAAVHNEMLGIAAIHAFFRFSTAHRRISLILYDNYAYKTLDYWMKKWSPRTWPCCARSRDSAQRRYPRWVPSSLFVCFFCRERETRRIGPRRSSAPADAPRRSTCRETEGACRRPDLSGQGANVMYMSIRECEVWSIDEMNFQLEAISR